MPCRDAVILSALFTGGLLLTLTGCPSSAPQPARRTATRPAARRVAPRSAPPQVIVQPLWEAKTGQQQARLSGVKYGCVLVLAGQYVARGTPQRELECLSLTDGKVRWRWSGGRPPLEVAATQSWVVTLRDAAGKHHFVDARTGRKVDRPKGRLPGPPRSAPLEVDGRRYLVEGHNLRCTHASTGKLIWESPTRGALSGLRVQRGVVYYAVAGERAIHARDARSGLGRWLHQVRPVTGVKPPRAASFSFAVQGQRLYVARYDGTVGAFVLKHRGKPAPLGRARPSVP